MLMTAVLTHFVIPPYFVIPNAFVIHFATLCNATPITLCNPLLPHFVIHQPNALFNPILPHFVTPRFYTFKLPFRFERQVCSTKIIYANALALGTNSCKKRNVTTLNSAAHIQQKSSVTCAVGQNDIRAVYIGFSESFQPKKFVRCCNKVERKYIQELQPNQFHCYNQSMGFVNRMNQNVTKYRIGNQIKKWWWSPFV